MRTVTCAWATKPPENDCRIVSIGAIIPALALIRPVVFVADRRTKNVFFAEGLDHPTHHGALSLQDKSRPLGSATSHASPSESPWQATYRSRLSGHRFPAGENSLAHVILWVVLWVAVGHYSYSFYFSGTYYDLLAEREGFEPSVGSHLRLISSQVHSATLPPLRRGAMLAQEVLDDAPTAIFLHAKGNALSALAVWPVHVAPMRSNPPM
jgi:hypothetical protein